jgi:ABC-type sulfate transport system permease subunit
MIKRLKQMFLEDDGTLSLSRVMIALTIDVVLGLLIYLVIKNSKFPDGTTLTGLGAFTSSVVTVLYGLNQMHKIITAVKGTNFQPIKDLLNQDSGSDTKG